MKPGVREHQGGGDPGGFIGKRSRGQALREIGDSHASGDLLLIDNIELLFDASLALNPLDLLERQTHARRVVAV